MPLRNLRVSLIVAIAVLITPMAAQAQWWQSHPHYLHAMSNLRMAYWLVQHRETNDPIANDQEHHALRQIRAAYQELKDASIMDNKNIDDQAPADTNFYDHRGRLHRALDLLREAHNDVTGEEEDPAALGLRHRALKHIDEAAHATDDAIHAWFF
jgi:hypothetical protein